MITVHYFEKQDFKYRGQHLRSGAGDFGCCQENLGVAGDEEIFVQFEISNGFKRNLLVTLISRTYSSLPGNPNEDSTQIFSFWAFYMFEITVSLPYAAFSHSSSCLTPSASVLDSCSPLCDCQFKIELMLFSSPCYLGENGFAAYQRRFSFLLMNIVSPFC